MADKLSSTFVPLRRAAVALGVPVAWLQREAQANRVPAVRAGRQWLVHLERTREILTTRAEGEGVTDAR